MVGSRLIRPLGAPGMPRLLAMCVVVGVVAGLGAAGFFVLLEAASALFLGGLAHYHEHRPAWSRRCSRSRTTVAAPSGGCCCSSPPRAASSAG